MSNAAEKILREIAKIERMERGSIAVTERPRDNGVPGRFYNHTVYENGRSHTKYVRRDDVKELKRLIAEHKKFRRLVAQYEDLIIGYTRAEREKSAGPRPIREQPLAGRNQPRV